MDAYKRTSTTRRHEYVITSPAPHVEVEKAMSWASADWKRANHGKTMYDNSLNLASRDDEIVVYWEEQVNDHD